METSYNIEGGGGLNLHVREWGNPDGAPIVFIHGWSGSHLVWKKQYQSALAEEFRLVALDLRGHGMSDRPPEPGHYADSRLWADDVAAVIEELRLSQPVLVGWSYGGFIISDYVRCHGENGISGLIYVGGAVTLNERALGTLIGPGFLDYVEGATQPDLPTNIETLRSFLRHMPAKPIPQDDYERLLASMAVVPAAVRAGLIARQVDSDDVLGAMTVPVLVTQGKEDAVILPAMAEHILEVCPTATASWYEDTGHMPFMESTERFNQELAAFVRRVASQRGNTGS